MIIHYHLMIRLDESIVPLEGLRRLCGGDGRNSWLGYLAAMISLEDDQLEHLPKCSSQGCKLLT